ncbi:MAG: hypothetical protein ACHQX1_02155, partial [Candidatus Micrarchaeales archaeon]
MRRLGNEKKIFLLFIILSIIPTVSSAQYWFQSGVQGDYRTSYNNGGSVAIQTIAPQQAVYGSLAYWIGETLSNGAFIQIGYQIPNESGYLPSNCSPSGCTG